MTEMDVKRIKAGKNRWKAVCCSWVGVASVAAWGVPAAGAALWVVLTSSAIV